VPCDSSFRETSDTTFGKLAIHAEPGAGLPDKIISETVGMRAFILR
jgi:hypothetical protein